MDTYDIVYKLVGKIKPVGESDVDTNRFENLRNITELVDRLLCDIQIVSTIDRGHREGSIKKAAKFAREFLENDYHRNEEYRNDLKRRCTHDETTGWMQKSESI